MTTTEQSFATTPQLSEKLKKYQNTSAFVGLVFLALLVSGYFLVSPQQFFRSYLVGFFFWFGMGAGCLLLLMTQYLTGGAWGMMIRRPLEAGARTLYVMFWGFLPLLLGVDMLYWWSTPEGLADKVIQAKHLYLNVPFLWVRWVIYGAVWLTLTYLLNKWSRLEEETKSPSIRKSSKLSARRASLLFFLTMTFCAVDYMMTLEPHWYSTVYGFMIVIGQALTAMCVHGRDACDAVQISADGPCGHQEASARSGQTAAGAVMLWAYLNFSQLLITWSGNLPDEIIWYIKRWNGGWGWVALILLLLHFCLPFLLLLSQSLKKNPRTIFGDRDLHHCDSHGGRILAGRAEFRRREERSFLDVVAGHRGAARLRRIVAGVVFPEPAAAGVDAAGRSGSEKGY